MPDQPATDAGDSAGLTPAQEAEVRRLLAAARHDEPAPDAVVARLDAALARLREESDPVREAERAERAAAAARLTEPVARATVVDLAARRRRRWTQVLVAAAAVVAVGVAAPEFLSGMGGGGDQSTSGEGGSVAEDSAGAGDTDTGGQGEEEAAPEAMAEPDGPSPSRANPTDPSARTLPAVGAKAFADDATRLRRTQADEARPTEEGAASLSERCVRDLITAARTVPVSFRGKRAVVVYTPVTGNRELAELYVCGRPEPVRQATVPVPE